MTSDSILVVEVILWVVAGVFALLAAYFPLLSALRNERHEKRRAWFRDKWVAIRESRWPHLPKTVIGWCLAIKQRIGGDLVRRAVSVTSEWHLFITVLIGGMMTGSALLAYSAGYRRMGLVTAAWISALSGAAILLEKRNRRWGMALFLLVLTSAGVSTIIMVVHVSLHWPILGGALLMCGALPVFFYTSLFVAESISRMLGSESSAREERLIIFGVAMSLSFSVTLLAMCVGHWADAEAWVPQTVQMLIANVIYDGLTMVVTFAILGWAVAREHWWRIPVAVVVDALIAAVLACCSLYFGLALTEKHLTVLEVLNVLRGLSPDAQGVSIGPYVCTMYTTFLPTIAYLALIIVCLLGKAALAPVAWFFGKGQENKNPLKLTAVMCAFLAVVFGLAAGATEKVRDIVKEGESQVQPAKPDVIPQSSSPPPAAPAPRSNGPTENS